MEKLHGCASMFSFLQLEDLERKIIFQYIAVITNNHNYLRYLNVGKSINIRNVMQQHNTFQQ
jgi:hypothetical protein